MDNTYQSPAQQMPQNPAPKKKSKLWIIILIICLVVLIPSILIGTVLIALLSPNVLKYLEKSKVGKDISTLDYVITCFHAEMMDNELASYTTDEDYDHEDINDKLEGKFLYEFEDASGEMGIYYERIFEAGILHEDFLDDDIFESKVAEDCYIKIFMDGKGGIAVAAVRTDGYVAEYEGEPLFVTSGLNYEDLEF